MGGGHFYTPPHTVGEEYGDQWHDEDRYREQVARFKDKWLARHTPKDRAKFYQQRFEEYASETMERFVRELGEVVA